ncbi:MAG TPA: efflux transporter outer membrane subunit [Burkholderiales bacterium]|nr:efflux transporter outer membrane subunit [Burkholderiales bacterium]
MRSLVLIAVAFLAGCSLAPKLEQPEVDVPAQYKALGPGEPRGEWKPAEPADAVPRGEWWKVFNDPTLNELEAQAIAANQTLKIAAARLAQSRAVVGVVNAERYPRVDAGFGPSRIKPTGVSLGLPQGTDIAPYTVWRGQLTAAWEVDLFGRISDSVAAARSEADAAAALYGAAMLAVQADVAQVYFGLRQTDDELLVVRETVASRTETLRLVQRRFDAGDVSELDLAQAKTEVGLAQTQVYGLERQRAQLENGLAVLLGKAPASFSLASAPLPTALPSIPPGLPSALLERRPDVAAASRTMAASNARIGVAKAAFFPVLRITGLAGYESNDLNELFQWSSRTWALGPIAGTILSMPIFDGGRNQANLDRSYAVLEESVGVYRQTVLGAFAEVEDNLVALRTLAGQAEATRESVQSATRALQVAESRYKAGATSYLQVVDSQRTLLVVQRLDAQFRGARAVSTVALIRALGGGWDPAADVSGK